MALASTYRADLALIDVARVPTADERTQCLKVLGPISLHCCGTRTIGDGASETICSAHCDLRLYACGSVVWIAQAKARDTHVTCETVAQAVRS